ncbi:MAG: hypothetical protein J07HR59_00694, partial [Halorubrum sp. J07HR59]
APPHRVAVRVKPAQGCFVIALAGDAETVWEPFVQRADPNPAQLPRFRRLTYFLVRLLEE